MKEEHCEGTGGVPCDPPVTERWYTGMNGHYIWLCAEHLALYNGLVAALKGEGHDDPPS